MLGLAALADPFIVTLFGAPWRPAVPILRVLCLAGALWPLHVVNLNVLLAQGHSSLYFRVEIAKKAVGILLLAIGCWFGIMGIAWSQVIFGVVAFVINAYYTRRFLGYGATHQVWDCLPILGSAAPMAAGVYWLSRNLGLVPWTALLGLAPLGAAIYLFLGWSFRLAALHDAVALVRGRAPEARPA
jgi:teichuronic acid exporter